MKHRKIQNIICLCVLAAGLCFTGCGKEEAQQNNEKAPIAEGKQMEVSFITIGKGDAFLLRTPEDTYYMYDTGKKEDYPQIQKVLKKKNVKELKGIFISHGHKDHRGNVKNLLKDYPVETVYISAVDQASYREGYIRELAEEYHASIQKLEGGEELNLEGVTANVWLPDKCDFQEANNNSVVIRFTYGEQSILMTGDMEYGEEAAFLQSGEAKPVDLLKLGHHGEKDATSVALLEKTKPTYGLITGNAMENPQSVNQEISARLEAFDVEAFYSEGPQIAIDFIFDGKEIKINHVNEN